jgi:outer membrane receptor protein involved in Fe transport
MRTKENITWNWGPGFPANTDLIYWDNPYFAAYENYSTDNRLRYLGNVKLDYKITPWLNAMGRISLDSYDQLQEERTAVGSIYFPAGEYRRRNKAFREYNYDVLLTADKKLNETFSARGALGVNIRKTTQRGISAKTNGGLSVPKIYVLTNSKNPIEAPLESDYYINKQVNGFFADAGIGYKEFLFLDGSFRRDIASSLPKGNNAYNYGQVSTSFVYSKFLENNPVLTFGKVRASYAEVGSDAPFNALTDQYFKPTPFGSKTLFSVPAVKNNSELVPERTKSYEVGMEANFFDGRVGFDVTYFKSETVDQIIPVSISSSTGYESKYVNAGTLENKGFEATLTATPIKMGAFTWDVSVNWTRIRNEVTELFGDVKNLTLSSYFTASGSLNAPLGGSYGTIMGTDYVYTNGERTINPTTGRYQRTTTVTNPIGSINPDWTGGVQNTITYKDLSLSFLVDAKYGGDVLSIDMYYGLAVGLYEETAGLNELGNPVRSAVSEGGGVLLKGVNPDGNINQTRLNMLAYPQMGTQTTGPTARYVYDASYVKLREVLLTYNLPSSLMARLSPLRQVSISAVGRNLWIIYKNLPYADPEDNVGAGNIQGIQSGALPAVRTIGFNVKATF